MSTAVNIDHYYRMLNIHPSATDEEITSMYKKLALKFHPDKNRDRLDWAHENMIRLNHAYSIIMTYRFQYGHVEPEFTKEETEPEKKPKPKPQPKKRPKRPVDHRLEEITREIAIKNFIRIREKTKDSLYRFFQYRLDNIIRREEVFNRGIFNEIVYSLRRSYQAINKLRKETKDREIILHLNIFNDMVFNFYKAAECLNIIDSYNDLYDVEAYRQYKQADDLLHNAQKEIFFDRHNRGYNKIEMSLAQVIQASKIFQSVLNLFPDSSWAVETEIKLKYAQALKLYIELFFADEDDEE